MSVRVRFAPSPTGKLHLGNVRTAIFNYLYARNKGGKFILRLEDTDAERSTEESVKNLISDLKWLGIQWDEGPEVGGNYGPYRQTERYHIYKEHLEKLVKEGKAYPCYCDKESLDRLREEAREKGRNFIYPGTCRNLTEKERKEKEAANIKPSFRLKITPHTVSFNDLIRGNVSIHTDLFGDFIIVRQDLSPTYNFAVVIDDYLMKITDVLRGEDHLSNTPKQIILYDMFGYEKPRFGHFSMILGPDNSKLSKRHGDVSLAAFREKGFLSEALFNALALLGWSDPDEREILKIEELMERFSLDRINKSAAVFDENKFRYINKQHIISLDIKDFAEKAKPYFEKEEIIPKEFDENIQNWFLKLCELIQKRVTLLSDVVSQSKTVFEYDPSAIDDEGRAVLEEEECLKVILAYAVKSENRDLTTREKYIELVNEIKNELKVKGKNLYHPLRLCVSSSMSGPDLDILVPVIEIGASLDLPIKIESSSKRAWRLVNFLREQGYKI
ncbi:MAG: glutamate--tRNA ligase [Thermoanaerobaculaceae bacterium]|nr:glutamate--tRNA ligase [Thermoanaerobaculaceae bacterium]